MNRYQHLFAQLRDRQEGALIPFLMLGDPDPETSFAHICAVVEAGADALELGIPYSDPVADGPTIVEAANRALAAGVNSQAAFALVKKVRDAYPHLPIGLLVYANLVHGPGVEHFFAGLAAAGADSVLVPDWPLREAVVLEQAGRAHGIENVFILPPNASAHTLSEVAQRSQGYVYLLSRAGVTGAERAAEMPLEHLIAALRVQQSAPPILGFGISQPSQVKAALAAGAAGVIVGSALVKVLAGSKGAQAIAAARQLVGSLKAATRP